MKDKSLSIRYFFYFFISLFFLILITNIFKTNEIKYSLDKYEKFVSKPYHVICVWTWKVIEIKLIDSSVDGIAHFINKLGVKARPIQSGNLSSSLRLMVLGLILGLVFALVLSVI